VEANVKGAKDITGGGVKETDFALENAVESCVKAVVLVALFGDQRSDAEPAAGRIDGGA